MFHRRTIASRPGGRLRGSRQDQVLVGLTGFAVLLSSVALVGAAQPAVAADGPRVGTPWAVSVGDSFISGEAGRWAGNTNRSSGAVDTGTTAYFDNAAGTAETLAGCHRSKSAEVHIGSQVNPLSKNLACSGSLAATTGFGTSNLKPGLDFYCFDQDARTPGTQCNYQDPRNGQALALQKFAAVHNVNMVNLSIGGNNFDFAGIVKTCILDYLQGANSDGSPKTLCSADPTTKAKVSATSASDNLVKIKTAIRNIHEAMKLAGYNDADYTIVVQNYPSPVADSTTYRYGDSPNVRQATGGCGFWNKDADWANNKLLKAINDTVATAAYEVKDVDRTVLNVKFLDLSSAFTGRRLCERTVNLLENSGLLTGRSPGAADKLEWVEQIRTATTAGNPYMLQESIHPSYWGQLALRNCVRAAYNGGAVRNGRCNRGTSGGLNAKNEPNMTFTPTSLSGP